MHCNLKPPDAAPVLMRFNYDVMPSLKSLGLSALVYNVSTLVALRYVVILTFHPVTLIFDY